MQAGGASIDADIFGVAASVRAARGGVQGLMKVTDKVNDERKSLQALSVGLRFIGQHRAPAVDLREHAVACASGDNVRVRGVGDGDGNINEVPGRSIRG